MELDEGSISGAVTDAAAAAAAATLAALPYPGTGAGDSWPDCTRGYCEVLSTLTQCDVPCLVLTAV
jgi:hypothetical protein